MPEKRRGTFLLGLGLRLSGFHTVLGRPHQSDDPVGDTYRLPLGSRVFPWLLSHIGAFVRVSYYDTVWRHAV